MLSILWLQLKFMSTILVSHVLCMNHDASFHFDFNYAENFTHAQKGWLQHKTKKFNA